MPETKVYRANAAGTLARGVYTLNVAPAAEDEKARTNNDWTDQNGEPVSKSVTFYDGVAIVEPNLANFLCAKGYARKSRPLLAA